MQISTISHKFKSFVEQRVQRLRQRSRRRLFVEQLEDRRLMAVGTGFDDVVVGAARADDGTGISNVIDRAGGDHILTSQGADVLIGGHGADTFIVMDTTFRSLVGGTGNDTLDLRVPLDLTTIRDNRILGFEVIDITNGTTNNTLTLTHREVLNLPDSSNTLTVIGNSGDCVGFESGWIKDANPDFAGFQIFIKGAAKLRVSPEVAIQITVIDLTNLGAAGTIVNGQAEYDNSGISVSNAGDINADGFDDIIVGAPSFFLSGDNKLLKKKLPCGSIF